MPELEFKCICHSERQRRIYLKDCYLQILHFVQDDKTISIYLNKITN